MSGAVGAVSNAKDAVSSAKGKMQTYVPVSVEDVFDEAGHRADEMRQHVRQHVLRGIRDVENGAELALSSDVATVRFLGQELSIDDKDATIVLVFPRGQPSGGAINLTEMVEDPHGQARKIFWRQHNLASQDTMNEGFESFMHGLVTRGHYQKVVRAKLITLFRRSGLKVVTFPSIDGDEMFAKISMNPSGVVIKHLAQRFSYTMPFREEAYHHVKPHGVYPGNKPMFRASKAVLAYGPYDAEISNFMQDFRTVDEIRIVEMQLQSLVSLEQLQQQGVISRYFAAAKHEDISMLHREWLEHRSVRRFSPLLSTCAMVCTIPAYGSKSGIVRDFFGEEISFFFRWFAFYTQMLGYLGGCGAICYILVELFPTMRQNIPIAFSVVMVVWATVFNQLFRNRIAQASQEWGMKDYEAASLSFDRAGYNPDLEGTWTQWRRRMFSRVIMVLFCCTFVWMISWIMERKKMQQEADGEEGTFFRDHGTVIVVSTIKVTSITWGYVAPLLADMQNLRTQARYDDALTAILATVKIFVTLWNFFYVAFVRFWTSPTCASTIEEASLQVWGEARLPDNLTTRAEALREMGKYSYMWNHSQPDGSLRERVCIHGCFPASSAHSRDGSVTNCYWILRQELFLFFIVHMVYTIAFLVIPMVKVKVEVLCELRRAEKLNKEGVLRLGQYSWLQFQAKCPAYEYLSWGGSRVEDFLECAIGFALITCFGIVFPPLAALGFFGNLVEYRLLAYRMTHVTCRPFPRGASGIGVWMFVFETISGVAIVVNVLLVSFFMYPIKGQPYQQLVLFILLEHLLLGIRSLIDVAIPDVPLDVKRIDDFNEHFRKTMIKYPPLEIPQSEQYDKEYQTVDLGLAPGEGLDTDLSRQSSSNSFEEDSDYGGHSPCCSWADLSPVRLRPL